MATTTPTYWGWFELSGIAELDDDDVEAYDLPDYNGPREGEGVYVDLYADPARTQPAGRLWAADGNRAGLLHVKDEDAVAYARIALALRRYKRDGKLSAEAFDEIAGDWTAGAVYAGPLEDIDDPDIPENAGI